MQVSPVKPERACTLRNCPPAICPAHGPDSACGPITRLGLFLTPGYVAASIARLVALEMRAIDALGRLSFLAAFWCRAIIAVLRMETVIHVALEFVGAMKPRASANEDFATKPFRAVVAGGSTVIRSDVIVTVGAIRSHADDDVDLSLCFGSGSRDAECSNSS